MEIESTLKVVSTTSARLGQLPVEYGQLIFVKDTRELYFDHQEGRVPYNQIIILKKVAKVYYLTNQVLLHLDQLN